MKKLFAFDVETTGLEIDARVFSYAFLEANPNVNISPETMGTQSDAQAFRDTMKGFVIHAKRLFKNHTLLMHNAKFDLSRSRSIPGITDKMIFNCDFEDSMLLVSVVRPQEKRLKEIAYKLFGYPKDDEEAVKQIAGANANDYSQVPDHAILPYNKMDVERTILVWFAFKKAVFANKKFREIYETEKQLIFPTIKMEDRGFEINIQAAEKLIKHFDTLRDKAKYSFPYWFSPSKAKDIQKLLYEELKLPVVSRTKKSREPSTGKDALLELYEKYQTPEIENILKWLAYNDGITRIEDFLARADKNNAIHCSINTCGAITGRESASEPNMQNVAKEGKLKNSFTVPVRSIFKPRDSFVTYHIDYSAIELRLIIHYSQDKRMVEIMNANLDPHREAAKVLYGSKFENANKETQKILRNAGKNGNFCIAYGGGMKRLAATLNLNGSQGKAAYTRFKQTFPGIANLNKSLSRKARMAGYIINVFGRRIPIRPDKSYIALNYMIQSTAADILKRAQIRVYEYLKSLDQDWHLILPIHDELIIEAPKPKKKENHYKTIRDIAFLMTDFPGMFSVPLEVECEKSIKAWNDLEEIHFNSK